MFDARVGRAFASGFCPVPLSLRSWPLRRLVVCPSRQTTAAVEIPFLPCVAPMPPALSGEWHGAGAPDPNHDPLPGTLPMYLVAPESLQRDRQAGKF